MTKGKKCDIYISTNKMHSREQQRTGLKCAKNAQNGTGS